MALIFVNVRCGLVLGLGGGMAYIDKPMNLDD
jgi:hypothetical protein